MDNTTVKGWWREEEQQASNSILTGYLSPERKFDYAQIMELVNLLLFI
jgi:hypothetical protein